MFSSVLFLWPITHCPYGPFPFCGQSPPSPGLTRVRPSPSFFTCAGRVFGRFCMPRHRDRAGIRAEENDLPGITGSSEFSPPQYVTTSFFRAICLLQSHFYRNGSALPSNRNGSQFLLTVTAPQFLRTVTALPHCAHVYTLFPI